MAIPYWDPIPGEDAPDDLKYGEGPEFPSNPWDLVIIDGKKLPGISRVRCVPTLAIDAKKPTGVDGGVITVGGHLPGPVDIETTIWTAEQFREWVRIIPVIWRKPTKKARSNEVDVSISHPALDMFAISRVVIKGVSVPENGSIPQSKVIRIQALISLPQTKTNQTKTARPTNVKVAREVDNTKNKPKDPPSKTDTGPTGAKKDTTPGSS